MALRLGVHEIRCRECGAVGTIRISRALTRDRVRVPEEKVEHAETCSYFVRPQPEHLKKKAWRKQEREANALVGARATLASGAVGEDGDGRTFHQWRVESKGTTASAYKLSQTVWEKLVTGALLAGEEPILNVVTRRGIRAAEAMLVVVRLDYFDAVNQGRLPDPIRDQLLISGETSHWITAVTPQPYFMDLDPEGVVLSKEQFLLTRGEVDVSSGRHLPSPRREPGQ